MIHDSNMSKVEDPKQEFYTEEVGRLVANLFKDTPDLQVQAEQINRILKEFMGDKNSRLLKNAPNQASQLLMREVIGGYVKESLPIPVLIVASACKLPLHGHSVDNSEVLFIRMLMDMQARVKSIYQPGFKLIIRLEDLTLALNLLIFLPIRKRTSENFKIFWRSWE
jgi:hypothetical protein